MGQWAQQVNVVRVIGTGVMGRGIAQLAAAAGLTVELADARQEAVSAAVDHVGEMFGKLVGKGRMSAEEADAATARLRPVGDPLAPADSCDLVVEAVREDLDTKRELFAGLEEVCPRHAVLATNTSSLSVTAIGAALADPSRLIGLHFFNPVPLMKLVEVIPGARTRQDLSADLVELVRRLGHQPVLATDTPGFLVNHAGRGLATEALQIMSESAVEPSDVDRIARDVLGLRMGPFELLDLTGLDVSHPVLESIWSGFYGDPRLRPSGITRSRLEAGLLGRKTGEGFYRYIDGVKQEAPEPGAPDAPRRPVWVDDTEPASRDRLVSLLREAGVVVEEEPSEDAVLLVTPYGQSAAQVARSRGLPVHRVFGVDPLGDFASRLVLAVHPAADVSAAASAHVALSATGLPVTVVADAPATIAQRLLASIVNTACGIAEQRIGRPADIDTAVRVGLGYPRGPLEWGEHAGRERILAILRNMHAETGDPRYRPSRWLVERAELGLALTGTGTTPAEVLGGGED
ncbi:3-hydroxybutyryl-CoA dehydrogenase [Saccharopolyspora erythraea NRRL 2338]|uniref:3-hydroxybutyryl-CoA dehydrogenase n=2 Tax=Saccharopolyspora erythraea TaxID=1836 RepID=A4FGV2_SACEN|nr:3-hydroxyacyl-CoA dehydrogenase [Saccharopolyspora erythraea]EQD82614.1 3-hydroxyacyl-CoA dehydrogenase [Saccharopolyspora erythraea D]PFG96981.1 3-hydroxybutyryl-CoA dehydrogenase [Saccharopolyspora erythraea NRRL 2338]QRK87197.1 3-hydroxyacyl-CoA dehydrogenase [Saccharopolyspora erythraea]CAM03277.1 3-hydroxybutyryl-CoA dehydrogenase [Saccharopolyspora erythraea NRRL 2338]